MLNFGIQKSLERKVAKILLAGATGLVGGHLLPLLVQDGHEVHVIGRRPMENIPDGVVCHIAAPSEWPDIVHRVGAEKAISCLGSTIKKAGSQTAFQSVDLDLLLAFASASKSAGARQFVAVSSALANSSANNFYLKTKGQAEEALFALDFKRLDILRPGLLKGRRKEFRLGETIAIFFSPVTDLLLQGKLRRFRSIPAKTVARAIQTVCKQSYTGQLIHENTIIRKLSG
jgi:uncharacterized protein YbjT (DUF2867 family)